MSGYSRLNFITENPVTTAYDARQQAISDQKDADLRNTMNQATLLRTVAMAPVELQGAQEDLRGKRQSNDFADQTNPDRARSMKSGADLNETQAYVAGETAGSDISRAKDQARGASADADVAVGTVGSRVANAANQAQGSYLQNVRTTGQIGDDQTDRTNKATVFAQEQIGAKTQAEENVFLRAIRDPEAAIAEGKSAGVITTPQQEAILRNPVLTNAAASLISQLRAQSNDAAWRDAEFQKLFPQIASQPGGAVQGALQSALATAKADSPAGKAANLTERQKNAEAAGLKEGTDEYNQFVLSGKASEGSGSTFDTKSLPGQAWNIILSPTADPSSQAYAAAWQILSQPHTTIQPDGTVYTVQPDLSKFRPPTGAGAGAPVQPGAAQPPPADTVTTQVPGATLTRVAGGNQTPQDIQKLKEIKSQVGGIKASLKNLQEIVNNADSLAWGDAATFQSSAGGRQLVTAWTATAMQAKAEALLNLGVLNGPDLDLIQKMLPNPATASGYFTSKEGYAASISEVGKLIDSKVAAYEQQYGPKPQNGAPPPADTDQPRAASDYDDDELMNELNN